MNKAKIGIYPGSFDPITNGHLDIIKRASGLFDKLIVTVLINYQKKTLFNFDERIELIKEVTKNIPNIEIASYEGLLADFARERNAKYIVRGLRAISDFEYELGIALTNRTISNKEIDTIFFMTDENNFFISSSLVKEITMLGGDIKCKIPDVVYEAMVKKFKINK